jgi:hypothetical protein
VNYFIGALGELLQRMSDPAAAYGLALPDNLQYRGLLRRLPELIWERLRLRFTVIFVSGTDDGIYAIDHLRLPQWPTDLRIAEPPSTRQHMPLSEHAGVMMSSVTDRRWQMLSASRPEAS